MKTVVTGATGTVGSAVLRRLLDDGHEAVAAVRHAGDRDLPDGAESVAFDVTKPDTFGPAFAGADTVFLMLPPGKGAHMNGVIDAAQAAGVRRVAFLSVLGAESNPVLPHRSIEKHLEASSMEVALLRASYFMQNLSEVHAADVRDGEIVVPAGAGRTSFVDARDVGDAAAVWLTDADRTPAAGAVAYDLTGPESLDYFDVAAVLSDVLGRRVVYTRPGLVEFYRHERAQGAEPGYAAVMMGLYTSARLGFAGRLADGVQRLLGRPPRSLRDFAEDYREAWV